MAETASAPASTGLQEADRAALHYAAVQQYIVVNRLYARDLFLVPGRVLPCFIPSTARHVSRASQAQINAGPVRLPIRRLKNG